MLSVVVLAADVVRIMSLPSECDPVLLVDANTVLPLPVTSHRLQAIAGNGRQVVETLRSVKHRQLPMHCGPEVAGHPPRGLAVSLVPQVRACGIRKRLDHDATIYGYRVSVNSQRHRGRSTAASLAGARQQAP